MPFSGLSLPKDDLNLIMKMEDSARLHIPKVYSGNKKLSLLQIPDRVLRTSWI